MSETGHAKNVGNFEIMVSRCAAMGAYDPSNANLTLAALGAKYTLATNSLDDVATALAEEDLAINARQSEFDGIRRFMTRVINALEACGADKKTLDDARTLKRKIDGARAKALEKPLPGEPPLNSISVSQQSYVQIVEHFSQLIALLDTSGIYTPNEPELQISGLQAKLASMEAATTTVNNKSTAVANARLQRNEVLYHPVNGLVAIAGLVKKYVSSLFGNRSAQYKQISGLRFTKPRTV